MNKAIHVIPEPLPTGASARLASAQVNDVRFRVDHASDRDINQLLLCLRRQPGVRPRVRRSRVTLRAAKSCSPA